MTMLFRRFLALIAAHLALLHPAIAQTPAVPRQATVFIAGDSTAQSYGADRYPQSGWGQYLQCGLNDGVRVANHAMAGRSTKTFISEGRWDRLMAEVQSGDIVLIQFGHNDASLDKPERYAEAQTAYRDNLLRFIWEVRGAKGVPVLLTPVARRNFGADDRAKADFPAYSTVVRDLATSTATPMIDLESLSRLWLDATGAEPSKALFLHYPAGVWPSFPKGIADDTHFSEIGARRMANLVLGALSQLPIPAAAWVREERPLLMLAKPTGTVSCQ